MGSDIRAVYIAGTGRNGSTLLGMHLAQHPEIFFAGELTHIWRRGFLDDQLCSCGARFSQCGFWTDVATDLTTGPDAIDPAQIFCMRDRISSFRNIGLPKCFQRPGADERNAYRAAWQRLVESIAERSGCKVVIDTSKYPTDLAAIAKSSCLAGVVHLVRDGRGVVVSWASPKRRPEIHWKDAWMPRYGAVRTAIACTVFDAAIETTVARLELDSRLIRYEDFATKPRLLFDELLDWLDLSANDCSRSLTASAVRQDSERHSISSVTAFLATPCGSADTG